MICLSHVIKRFPGGVTAVNDVSFEVPKGSITCLIGTSGCGKTTTLKMINRLVEPSEGEITVNGEAIESKDPIQLRRSIGYVIQKGGLLPHMTVAQNIGLVEKIQGTDSAKIKERVHFLLDLVSLKPDQYARRFPRELSGGQQQRVGIARALMSDPPVLLMDEPFGALDPITRAHLHKEFLELNKELHKTIVLVTHDLAEAFKLGDQIVLMNGGQIVQKGTKKDFLEAPASDFAREFVSSQLEGIQ